MKRNAERRWREAESDGWRCRRKLVWAPLAITLALGACSSLAPREGRLPSLRVANAALASGAPELALRIADLELAKRPNDASALVARGDALYALGRGELAGSAYRAAIKIDPRSVAAQVGLGRTLVQSDPSAAEAAFLSALSLEPDNVVALNDLGVVRDLQGRHADAQQAYSHAISVAPTSADVQINLGMSLALSGHATEASQMLRSMASDPGVKGAWRKELANALTVAGDGAWAQQALSADAMQPSPNKTVPAEAPELALREASPSVVELAKRPSSSFPNELPLNTPSEQAATETDLKARAAAPSESRQLLAISPDPREPVIASSLLPVSSKRGGRSSDKPVGSSSEQAARIPKTQDAGPKQLDAIAGPQDRLDRFAIAAVPRPEDVASAQSEGGVDDYYVQLASLTSESGALFEWDRLKKRLPQFLGDRGPTVTSADVRGRTYWRLRTFGFASSLEAKQLCRELKQSSLQCWTGRGV